MRQIPILMYHWFRADASAPASRSPQLEITPQLFERQMLFLEQRGYRTVSLVQACGAAAELPPRPVVLTFDDGTLDFWKHARPVLDRLGFRASLFIVTGHVGGESSWDRGLGEPARPLLGWDQLAELQGDGHEIGSHSHTHRVFTELGDDTVREELERSRRILEERLGTAPDYVAYPRGFYREEHKRIAREAGYLGACTVALHWRDLLRADPYALKRMTVKGTESMSRFRLRLRLAGMVRC